MIGSTGIFKMIVYRIIVKGILIVIIIIMLSR